MIGLRRKIELAVAHPVWGPIVIITLAVLLGLVFVHVVFNDAGFVANLGAICFGVVTVLAAIPGRRFLLELPLLLVGLAEKRGPPRVARRSSSAVSLLRTADFVLPLRR